MSTVRFGTLCDLCGAGSRDYAQDASPCESCEIDLCDSCAELTAHALVCDWDADQTKLWGCESDSPISSAARDLAVLREYRDSRPAPVERDR